MRTTSSILSACAPLRITLALMPHHGFGDLAADALDRIKCERRLLKDHRNGPATEIGQLLVGQREHLASKQPDCVRLFGNRCISARKVTLLPDPDSPSSPSTRSCRAPVTDH